MINQYIFELTIIISRRDEDDVNIQYQDNEDKCIIFRNEIVFKYFVNKHVNNCRECFDVIYRFDEDEKCFRNEKCFNLVVDFHDEFIIRDCFL